MDSEEATGLGVMGEQRLAETACSRLSRRKVSTLLGGKFKEPGVAWRAAIDSAIVMHRSNNT
ncbi:MAG TPA: hypothetical protein VJN94_03430 [Candidatus Binataceae bacterium]|nr:hypothetical protein [Candidatus Binataceae bacterium]